MVVMEEDEFYNSQTPSSSIKAKIVAEYFPQYARILLKKPQKEIRYLDLFAGPGKYRDQNHSTPLLLAKSCSDDPILAKTVRLLFNDKNYIDELRKNFNECFPEGTFALEPRFGDKTVGENEGIRNFLLKGLPTRNPYPTLLFFDPWGYKGIDTLVLSKFLSGWGNEIFLFVNIKRIHAAIENEKFGELMRALFPTTIQKIKKDRKYNAVSVYDRLNLIMSNLATEFALSVSGKLFHCAFKFQEEDSDTTSHFILHLTKHPKGYELVKQIYYNYDNIGAILERDGSYTFDAKRMGHSTEAQINFGDQNVRALSELLLKRYKRRTLTAQELFNEHQPSNKYCGSHYVKTLRQMVEKGLVKASFTDNSEHKKSVLLTSTCKLEFL